MTRTQQIASCIAALLFAALAPALAETGLERSILMLPTYLVLTLGHAVLLGLPLFLILRLLGRKRWITAISSVCVGFLIGALPLSILALWFWDPLGGGNVWADDVPTIVNGIPTLAGWLIYGKAFAVLGRFGAFGGLVFWATLKVSGSLEESEAKEKGATGLPGKTYGSIRARVIGLTIIAVLMTVAIFAIPDVTKDRTCHNMFRNGLTSIGSQVNIEVDIRIEDWPKLTKLFESFGKTHNFSLRNLSRTRPGEFQILALSLCNERGAYFSVNDQRLASHNFDPLIKGWGTLIGVYEGQEGSGWKQSTRDMVSELDSAWPGMVKFRDGSGRVIPMPDALQNPEANAPTAPGTTTEKH